MEWRVFIPVLAEGSEILTRTSRLYQQAIESVRDLTFQSPLEQRTDDYLVLNKVPEIGLKFRHGEKLEMKLRESVDKHGIESWGKVKFKKKSLEEQKDVLLNFLQQRNQPNLAEIASSIDKKQFIKISKSRKVVSDGSVTVEYCTIEVMSPESVASTVTTSSNWISIAIESSTQQSLIAYLLTSPHAHVLLHHLHLAREFLHSMAESTVGCLPHLHHHHAILAGYPAWTQYIAGEDAETSTSEFANGSHACLEELFRLQLQQQSSSAIQDDKPRLKMFVSYHNNHTQLIASNFCKDLAWCTPVEIIQTGYIDFYLYSSFFKTLDYTGLEYIGLVSYQTIIPGNGHHCFSHDSYDKVIKYIAENPTLGLFPFYINGPMLFDLKTYHGQESVDALLGTLRALNISNEAIKEHSETSTYFSRNCFIAKAKALQEVSQWMDKAIQAVETTPSLKELYEKDVHYGIRRPEVTQRLYGTDYYKLYSFVMERLVPFFFKLVHAEASDKSICM